MQRTNADSPSPSRAARRPRCDLIPADAYTVAELTDIYNQTRIDYIVPMPMNPARLQEYIDNYDLDLTRSVVARTGDKTLGLAMLGVRPSHTWITRLGVVPDGRHLGAGHAMMSHLIEQSYNVGASYIILEVICGNVPAHTLFVRLGFEEVRELLILRRPPGAPKASVPAYDVVHGDESRALELLQRRRSAPSWLDEYESLRNAGSLASIEVTLADGAAGWLAYQTSVFQLGRLVVQTEQGDPASVAATLAHALHTTHPHKDTKTENLPALDEHLPGLQAMRYMESFRRTEMRRPLDPAINPS